jgi:cyclohexadieny/prephenate dehydrogenase
VTGQIFERIAVIGLGLIGSSLCHAVRRSNLAGHIAGYARSAETRDKAAEIGFVDSIHDSASQAAENADLVIICTPIGAYGAIAKEISGSLMPGAILSDVGSVKKAVIESLQEHVPDNVHFIPGHPIAGTEESGPEAGFAELFDNRWCILTPEHGVETRAIATLSKFWEACGSDVEVMSAEHHDLVLAITSHLPHLIAYNIVGTVTELEEDTKSEVIKFSASGFRDFTRIAASDPTMWRDIFLNNKDAVLEVLGRFNEDLSELQRAVRRGDGDKLHRLFSATRDVRRGILELGQDRKRKPTK